MSLTFPFELPLFRYQVWDNLPDSILKPARDILGYDKDTWNYPTPDGSNDIEGKDWSSLVSSEQQGATDIGFTEETWDCWVNHYFFYDWTDLEDEEVAQYWEVLGWDEDSWDGKTSPPASDSLGWGGLSTAEQQAAASLCYFESTWEELEMTDTDFELPNSGSTSSSQVAYSFRFPVPTSRYTEWGSLPSLTQSKLRNFLGYRRELWNHPTTHGITIDTLSNDIEGEAFDSLDADQQKAVEDLIGLTEDTWNCWVNHYIGFTWDEMVSENVAQYWAVLGWDKNSWDGVTTFVPASDGKDWYELTTDEQVAAMNVCYFEAIWDLLKLTDALFIVP